jgi:polysaccharide export outer membrane protein
MLRGERSVLERIAGGVVRAALCALGGLALAALGGCAGPGQYVWYTEVPREQRSGEYVIAAGDVLSVRVVGHEDMATKVRVRADGGISIPFIQKSIGARGKTPDALSREIEVDLSKFFNSPSVSVNVEETLPASVAILGEVGHPGVFPLGASLALSQAIALGGGVTEFAARDRIFVVRVEPPARIRFTYEAVIRDEAGAGQFALRPGDVVVVE